MQAQRLLPAPKREEELVETITKLPLPQFAALRPQERIEKIEAAEDEVFSAYVGVESFASEVVLNILSDVIEYHVKLRTIDIWIRRRPTRDRFLEVLSRMSPLYRPIDKSAKPPGLAAGAKDKPVGTEGHMAGLKELAAQRGVPFLSPDDEIARELSGLSYGEITKRLGVTEVDSAGCRGYPFSKLETDKEKQKREAKYQSAIRRLARRT